MTTIRPILYNGNGYHMFLINGWNTNYVGCVTI